MVVSIMMMASRSSWLHLLMAGNPLPLSWTLSSSVVILPSLPLHILGSGLIVSCLMPYHLRNSQINFPAAWFSPTLRAMRSPLAVLLLPWKLLFLFSHPASTTTLRGCSFLPEVHQLRHRHPLVVEDALMTVNNQKTDPGLLQVGVYCTHINHSIMTQIMASMVLPEGSLVVGSIAAVAEPVQAPPSTP